MARPKKLTSEEAAAEVARSRQRLLVKGRAMRNAAIARKIAVTNVGRNKAIWIGAAIIPAVFIARAALKARPLLKVASLGRVASANSVGLSWAIAKVAWRFAGPSVTAAFRKRFGDIFDRLPINPPTKRPPV